MTPESSRDILPEPTAELKQHSQRLAERLRERIASCGPIPFSSYMEAALYEPGLGYYSAGLEKLGPGGDFITAPELGELFGSCLARQIEAVCTSLQKPEILEIGAGSGALAATLLNRFSHSDRHSGMRYNILERSADLRQRQKHTLLERAPAMFDRVTWIDAPPVVNWQGVLLANEVVDALPVELFTKREGSLQQMFVKANDSGFDWHFAPPAHALEDMIRKRLDDVLEELPEGYRSEINVSLHSWLSGLTETMTSGCALLIDYGYERRDYYHPSRSDGSLICHYRHRAVDAPFRWPGLQDITAFVDFTALAEAGMECGLDCNGYTSQAMFLLGNGLEHELAILGSDLPEAQLDLRNEARRLTLPNAMGEKFKVMALTRGLPSPLPGFELQDLRHRL